MFIYRCYYKILVLLAVSLFSSCSMSLSKRGCTDENAENYEPGAKKDCSCCYYNGRLLIYFYKYFNDYIASRGITDIYFYADGEKVEKKYSKLSYFMEYGSTPPSVGSYKPYSYDTYGSEQIVAINIGSRISKTITLEVKGPNGELVWQGFVGLIAGQIILLELK